MFWTYKTEKTRPSWGWIVSVGALKSVPEWSIIPTVVFSGSADPDDIKKSCVLGASSYLIKPGEFTELRRVLKVLHDYWLECRIPEVDITGKRVETDSKGKLGERFPQAD